MKKRSYYNESLQEQVHRRSTRHKNKVYYGDYLYYDPSKMGSDDDNDDDGDDEIEDDDINIIMKKRIKIDKKINESIIENQNNVEKIEKMNESIGENEKMDISTEKNDQKDNSIEEVDDEAKNKNKFIHEDGEGDKKKERPSEEDKRLLALHPKEKINVIYQKIQQIRKIEQLLNNSAEIHLQPVYDYIRELRKQEFEIIRNKYKHTISNISNEFKAYEYQTENTTMQNINKKKIELLLKEQQNMDMLRFEYHTQNILDKQLKEQQWEPPEPSPILEDELNDNGYNNNDQHLVNKTSPPSSSLFLSSSTSSSPSHLNHIISTPPLTSSFANELFSSSSLKSSRFSKRLSKKKEKIIQREKITEAMKRGLPPQKY
ncbi:hypothetical protein BJ944DRAFT_259137 [Cunninghamella echinulata]|nr:hypothetical protein BJ944DRAFT_259137 [Cunninghamella echinulata]